MATYTDPPNQAWQEAWLVTEALVRQMHAEVEARGKLFMVLTVSSGPQVGPDQGRGARWSSVWACRIFFMPRNGCKTLASIASPSCLLRRCSKPMPRSARSFFTALRIQVLGRATGMWPVIGWLAKWLQSGSVMPCKGRDRIRLRGLRWRRAPSIRRPSLDLRLLSSPAHRTTRLRGVLGGWCRP